MAEAAPAPAAAAAASESKPKKVVMQKPDKSKLQRETDEIQAEITVLQNESKGIKAKIDKIINDRSGSKGEFEAAKAVMQGLISEKKQVMNERNALGQSRDGARDKINAKINAEKAARAELKFSNVESIDSQIRELETRQARTTMSLNDEKKIIKDIKALQQSKKTVTELTTMKAAIDQLKAEKAAIDKSYADKNQELKVLNDKLSAQREVMDALNKDNTDNRDVIPSLRNKMTELREQTNVKYQAMKTMRAEFKVQEDAYYAFLAEEKARKKEAYEKEKKARAELEEARRKELEEEELKRVPYEEEMLLCDYLVTYLESHFLPKDDAAVNGDAPTSAAAVASLDGMKVLKRDEAEFGAMGSSKKRGKKKGGANAAKRDVITHGVDTIDSFAMLEIVPPSSVSGVQTAIDQLKAKKASFSTMERGQVESIASKMRASEKEKNKVAAEGGSKKAKSVFNLEADFPDLAIEEAKKQEA
jgi:uncharacterized coiled-coil DUF342 family protein